LPYAAIPAGNPYGSYVSPSPSRHQPYLPVHRSASDAERSMPYDSGERYQSGDASAASSGPSPADWYDGYAQPGSGYSPSDQAPGWTADTGYLGAAPDPSRSGHGVPGGSVPGPAQPHALSGEWPTYAQTAYSESPYSEAAYSEAAYSQAAYSQADGYPAAPGDSPGYRVPRGGPAADGYGYDRA
jgi:hypothetical protein